MASKTEASSSKQLFYLACVVAVEEPTSFPFSLSVCLSVPSHTYLPHLPVDEGLHLNMAQYTKQERPWIANPVELNLSLSTKFTATTGQEQCCQPTSDWRFGRSIARRPIDGKPFPFVQRRVEGWEYSVKRLVYTVVHAQNILS